MTEEHQPIIFKKKTIRNCSNIFLISDLHLGVRSSSEEWQENQKEFFYDFFIPTLKKDKNVESVLFVLGDVFDDRKAINIAVNEFAISLFSKIASLIPIYIINGNHDLYKKTNQGATSLRSLEHIGDLTLVTEPTMFTIGKQAIKIACIPYLGSIENETKFLIKASQDCQYAFMHTDISHMKYDNYREIQNGVNNQIFKGKIYSGHIHKRQENENVIYVGAPYQMRRSDIGNKTGFYNLDIVSGSHKFIENTISPIFQKIEIEYLFSIKDNKELLRKIIDHNYTDVLIKEEDLKKKYKPADIYNIINECNPKRYSISIIPDEKKRFAVTDQDIQDTSIDDLICNMIDSLDDKSDEQKKILKSLSEKYVKEALAS